MSASHWQQRCNFDYADTQPPNFAIEYLREIEKVSKTVHDKFVQGKFVHDRFVPGRFVHGRFVHDKFVHDRFDHDRFVHDKFFHDRFVQ